jgi:putative ABC transport system permease protein
MFESLWRDVRYAARSLWRTPGFTIIAVLTLAFGIGANAAIFSVFDAVLLRPLPYRDADRLHVIHEIGSTGTLIPANALHFREWRASTRSFDQMALIGPATYDLRGTGAPVRINGARVTPSLFETLGVIPALGRTFREEEDVEGRDRVVILGHEIWRTRFGGDPAVVGRTITLDDAPHVVVGVLPASFALPKLSHLYALEVAVERPDIWKPFAATARDLRPLNSFSYIALARTRAGVSIDQAADDLNRVQQEVARRAPEPARFSAALVPLNDQIVSRSRTALQLVLAAVALVLLIACVNITNLLLARSGRRQREFAIRRASGADQHRLLSQLVVEGLVLSFAAGLVGLLAGAAMVQMIRLTAPVDVPRIDEASLDWRAIVFTLAVTLCTGVLIGLVPAWRTTRASAADLLRSGSTTAMTGQPSGRLRSLLVSVEVAASAVCLVAGLLLLGSFTRLLATDRGFEGGRVITADFVLAPPRYDTAAGVRFLNTLTERVRALPGVSAAGVTDVVPLSGTSTSAIMVEGSTLPRPQRPGAMIRFADRGYFQTFGITLVRGRLLDDQDRGVAVVTERAARELWPQQDPIGKRFRHGPDDSPFVEVVGVVRDVRAVALTEEPPLSIYRPVGDYFYGLAALGVKTTADPRAMAPAIQSILREMDPDLVLPTPRTMDEIVSKSIAQPRFQMNLMILLAGAAVFLAGLGIYGVVSQTVVQRTGEFGIRMALGAASATILVLVLRRAMLPVAVGLAVGLAASLGVERFLRALLFGVSPSDVMPFVAAAAFLAGVALLASVVPALRATRVNPLDAIRAE